MALRTAQKGKNAGRQFWGCTGYPECKNVAEI
jgi:ssDNA-binding Zn-finger/Zn-ribbon topoisomerase 1